jgi:hypothetical protein
MTPSSVFVMIASSDESTTAASQASIALSDISCECSTLPLWKPAAPVRVAMNPEGPTLAPE